mmetsp:Transcript_45015/g.68873  ORF Transcript_45015/g.68873 Transcript_45015/m.68873 type:complete len:87 (+) Transcript_45015:31-291(+)
MDRHRSQSFGKINGMAHGWNQRGWIVSAGGRFGGSGRLDEQGRTIGYYYKPRKQGQATGMDAGHVAAYEAYDGSRLLWILYDIFDI